MKKIFALFLLTITCSFLYGMTVESEMQAAEKYMQQIEQEVHQLSRKNSIEMSDESRSGVARIKTLIIKLDQKQLRLRSRAQHFGCHHHSRYKSLSKRAAAIKRALHAKAGITLE